MPNLNNKKNKRIVSELDIFLVMELGVFSSLKGKKIRFNPKPDSSKTADVGDENQVEYHLEIVKEIDQLIEKPGEESHMKVPKSLSKKQQTLSLNEVMEIREPQTRKPEIPNFQTDIELKNVFGELGQDKKLFEIEIPTETPFNDKNKQENSDDFVKWILDELDKKSQKSSMGLGQIRVREKNKTTNHKASETKKINNFTKTKIELEETKREIEEKKKALEEAIEKEKAKELELKKKGEEKKSEEKLQKLELKKRLKEKKLREKEAEKAERQKEKELKNLEQEKIKEEQIKKIEKEKAEKQKELEKKKREKEEKLKYKKSEKKGISFFKKEKVKDKKEEEEDKLYDTDEIQLDEIMDEKILLDDDVEKLLPIIDELLENLPNEVIDEFAQSENFTLYEKVMSKYKKK